MKIKYLQNRHSFWVDVKRYNRLINVEKNAPFSPISGINDNITKMVLEVFQNTKYKLKVESPGKASKLADELNEAIIECEEIFYTLQPFNEFVHPQDCDTLDILIFNEKLALIIEGIDETSRFGDDSYSYGLTAVSLLTNDITKDEVQSVLNWYEEVMEKVYPLKK
ncbi:MAG: hypothetical protein K0R54_732 [Clostridiaceae bacterium]|jgi:hypothetical protein|nr:hypothetical protein [Clostridiaceae bacterium]